MSDHASILRGAGLRATPQRLALLHALGKAKSPQTAEELHAKADADLATVYRNLQSLVKAGVVQEARFKDASVRYELSHGHHHHIVCTTCGAIEELDGCNNSPLEQQALRASEKFSRINEHSLEFFGICRSCA